MQDEIKQIYLNNLICEIYFKKSIGLLNTNICAWSGFEWQPAVCTDIQCFKNLRYFVPLSFLPKES